MKVKVEAGSCKKNEHILLSKTEKMYSSAHKIQKRRIISVLFGQVSNALLYMTMSRRT